MNDYDVSLIRTVSIGATGAAALSLIVRFLHDRTGANAVAFAMLYGLVIITWLVSFVSRGAGFAQHGALAELVAGFSVFSAALWAWPARIVLRTVIAMLCLLLVVGLYELITGAAPVAGLLNVNHFACFVTTALPIVAGMALHNVPQRKWQAVCLSALVVAMLALLVISKCRTALAVSAVMLLVMGCVYGARVIYCRRMHASSRWAWRTAGWRSIAWRVTVIAIILMLAFAGCAAALKYTGASSDKSLSASGRILIWRLACRIAQDNWPHGVGFGNIGRLCNLYQATYFAEVNGSAPLRMAAGQIGHAFSEPLEAWAELGVWGLIMLMLLGLVIVRETIIVIRAYTPVQNRLLKKHGICSSWLYDAHENCRRRGFSGVKRGV